MVALAMSCRAATRSIEFRKAGLFEPRHTESEGPVRHPQARGSTTTSPGLAWLRKTGQADQILEGEERTRTFRKGKPP